MILMPLAAIDEWLRLLIPAVFLLYAIIQLIASKGAATKAGGSQPRKPQRRRPPDQAERTLGQTEPVRPPAGQSQLNAEIEQFLKRASQRRERSQRESGGAAKQPARALRQPVQPPVEARSVGAPLSRREVDPVAASVEKHLANRGFAERAEHMADEVVRAEGQFEDHVKKAFSRKIGTLDQTTTATPAAPVTDVAPSVEIPTPASAIAALLASSQNVRQALVLNEILTRPVHRW